MNDKNTPAKSEAPAEGLVAVRSIKDERDKSGLGKLLDELPAPFISLNCVIEVIAEANDGSFKEAARRLRILFESEADFPSWYRWTDAKSKGNLDPENGVKWGPRLIQHAEMVGKPVEFPHNHYRDCGYDLSAMPEGSIDHFLVYGPTIGFQRSDIGPFLTHHGLSGVDAIVEVVAPDSIGPASTAEITVVSDQPEGTGGKTKRERQILAILEAIKACGHSNLRVPYGGKKEVMSRCKETRPDLFGSGDDPFKDAWKEASKAGRLSVQGKARYTGSL